MGKRRAVFLAMLVLGMYFIMTLWRNLSDFSGLDVRVDEIESEVEFLRQENERLLDLKEKVGTDDYVEREIRDKLGLVKPGETVVILPDEYMSRESIPLGELGEKQVRTNDMPNWEKWLRLFFGK